MKAIVQDRYGSPAVLELREVEAPLPGDGGVLVRVHAASVNALDWHTTRGLPYIVRAAMGFSRPRAAIRGVDLSGRVEAVGRGVTRFKPGDEVFGGSDGSFAELVATPQDRLTLKPPGLTHEAAATLNVAGLTALQGLRDRAGVRPGQRVLIVGAGGGVGTFAVQVARWLGAHVTGVTRTTSLEMVRSLGAEAVIDHTAEDFTRRGEQWDVLFDIGGGRALTDCRRALTPRGVLVEVGGPPGRWLAPATRMLGAITLSPFVSQRLLPFVSKNDAAGLALLADLVEKGKIRPVIDRGYPLAETADAIRYVGEGHARGKVIIRVQ